MPSRQGPSSLKYPIYFLRREKSQNSQKEMRRTTPFMPFFLRFLCLFAAAPLPNHSLDSHPQMLNMPILHAQRDACRPMKSSRLRRCQQLRKLRQSLRLLARFLGQCTRVIHKSDPINAGGHFHQASFWNFWVASFEVRVASQCASVAKNHPLTPSLETRATLLATPKFFCSWS